MDISNKIKQLIFVKFKIWKYEILSNCKNIEGKPNNFHPLLIVGSGKVIFGKNVQNGVINSPYFYSNYSYLEVRDKKSLIKIGDNVTINNKFSAVAFSAITIKNDVVIGVNCSIIDSDGHHLNPNSRNEYESIESKSVLIEENVFIGDNVVILKGVTIGKNSVIGNSSVVTKNVAENTVVAGNPARVIKSLI